MTEPTPDPSPLQVMSRNGPSVALRLARWLLPSIALGFAVPGFLVLQLTPSAGDGSYVITATAMDALRQAGWSALILSAIVRAVLWPPPALRAVVQRYS